MNTWKTPSSRPERTAKTSAVISQRNTDNRGKKISPVHQTTIINNNTIVNNLAGRNTTREHRYGTLGYSGATYHDRPYEIKHGIHSRHIYRDFWHRTHYRAIWPRYHFALCYNFGNYSTFSYCYPYYHRKYVFVSIGGWWPVYYTYPRYYWYGYHPYAWYGYYPVAAEIRGDTYNYYTYDYYYTGEGQAAQYTPAATTNYITPVDHTTFADIRAKLAAEAAAQPDQATAADTYFEDGVKAFENDDYAAAIEKFAEAMKLAPDDIILPFAYAQALFANGQYSEAATILRTALANIKPEEQTVFYPRGLYGDDDKLLDHIDKLSEKAEFYGFDADLQLLLGYHLLGVGELDAAVEPLSKAGQDFANAEASQILLKVLEKAKAEAAVEAARQEDTN
ncbi:MAG TPA: tetratricopeptide repeat protein [Sedimentisphaerales bacterium]|nr:tetratricopeptide repeat protein [Sedimentisphaerales bacterium]